MANVKANFETLAEQINFIQKTIDLIANHDHRKVLAVHMDESNMPTLENILSNLRMVQSWVMLPDFHQAALQVLDRAHEQNDALQKGGDPGMILGDFLDHIYILTQRSASGEMIDRDAIMRIASFALIAVAKFVTPTKQVKEVNNG